MGRSIAAAAVLVISAPTFAESDLDRARAECERDLKACARVKELETAARAEADRRYEADRAKREAEQQAALERARAEEAAEEQREETLRKKCGKDYMRVRVGMSFARVRQCAGPFDLKYEDQQARVYEGSGGLIRVEKGRVTRVHFR